jgi:hypothetical protein
MLRRQNQRCRANSASGTLPTQLKIVVATKNSAAWIGSLLEEYQRLGIQPLILLDGYSDDDTEQILLDKAADYKKVYPEFPRVEAVIREIPEFVNAEWALRLDDDEFPSAQLIRWLQCELANATTPILGVPRRWLRLSVEGRCEYSRHPLLRWLDDAMDIQWRLFKPAQVQYTSEIHTAGFLISDSAVLPDEAYLVHFDWILRTASERAAKVAHYDQQQPNAGSKFRALYVWETSATSEHAFVPMETAEFDRLAQELASIRK